MLGADGRLKCESLVRCGYEAGSDPALERMLGGDSGARAADVSELLREARSGGDGRGDPDENPALRLFGGRDVPAPPAVRAACADAGAVDGALQALLGPECDDTAVGGAAAWIRRVAERLGAAETEVLAALLCAGRHE